MIKYEYPVVISKDKNGSYIVEFPNVPEAITLAKNEKDALERAKDALIIILESYLEDNRNFPMPSRPKKNQLTVSIFIDLI